MLEPDDNIGVSRGILVPAVRSYAARPLSVLASPGLAVREHNPYTWLLYSQMQCTVDDFSLSRAFMGRYEVLHLHWPEIGFNASPDAARAYLQLKSWFLAVDIMKSRGTRVVWTVHNLESHDRRYPRLERWFWRELIDRLDGYIALSADGKTQAMNRFPRLRKIPGFVVPHGHYREEYPDTECVSPRRSLSLPERAKIFLFFGQIRPYKNLPLLINTFRACAEPDLLLYIAGQSKDEITTRELLKLIDGDTRIRLEPNHVPKEQVHIYFKAADLIVLPYRDILNSGAAILALSFNRPALVPNKGTMGELSRQIGSKWVRTFERLTSCELSASMAWALSESRPQKVPLEHLDWRLLASQTLDAYRSLLGNNR